MNIVWMWVCVAIPMTILDAVWLTIMTSRFYTPQLGSLLRIPPNWTAATLFYFLYTIGIMHFVVRQGIEQNQSLVHIGIQGAVLGILAYGTYDLTNHATLQKWSTTLTIVDMAWGGVLTSTVAVSSVLLYRLFSHS